MVMEAKKQPKTAAQRQRERRERVLRGRFGPTEKRIQMYLHSWAAEKLRQMAEEDGKTQKETIEKLITNEANKRAIEKAKWEKIAEEIKNVTLSQNKT